MAAFHVVFQRNPLMCNRNAWPWNSGTLERPLTYVCARAWVREVFQCSMFHVGRLLLIIMWLRWNARWNGWNAHA